MVKPNWKFYSHPCSSRRHHSSHQLTHSHETPCPTLTLSSNSCWARLASLSGGATSCTRDCKGLTRDWTKSLSPSLPVTLPQEMHNLVLTAIISLSIYVYLCILLQLNGLAHYTTMVSFIYLKVSNFLTLVRPVCSFFVLYNYNYIILWLCIL